MELLSIANWGEHFENSRTRTMAVMRWVPVPNKLDGDGYTELISQENGAALYGAWVAILAISSRCSPRGELRRSSGIPHDAESISRITRIEISTIEAAITVLINIGWLLSEDVSVPEDTPNCHERDRRLSRKRPRKEGNRREGNGKEWKGVQGETSFPGGVSEAEFIAAWNALRGVTPVRGDELTPKRRKAFRARLKTPGWDWREAMLKFPLQCTQGEPDSWRPGVDWFLRPDSVTAILEGRYDFTPRGSRAGPANRGQLDFSGLQEFAKGGGE